MRGPEPGKSLGKSWKILGNGTSDGNDGTSRSFRACTEWCSFAIPVLSKSSRRCDAMPNNKRNGKAERREDARRRRCRVVMHFYFLLSFVRECFKRNEVGKSLEWVKEEGRKERAKVLRRAASHTRSPTKLKRIMILNFHFVPIHARRDQKDKPKICHGDFFHRSPYFAFVVVLLFDAMLNFFSQLRSLRARCARHLLGNSIMPVLSCHPVEHHRST